MQKLDLSQLASVVQKRFSTKKTCITNKLYNRSNSFSLLKYDISVCHNNSIILFMFIFLKMKCLDKSTHQNAKIQ